MQQTTIAEALTWSCREIERTDARILLQYVLSVNHAFLLTHPDQVLASEQQEKFHRLVTQRIEGMPIAYLIGERAFYDLTFKVTTAVLIPRPETELLVELALAHITDHGTYKILDLGTGSGAIAVTIAKYRPQSTVVAVDLSIEAASIAEINAKNLGVNNIRIVTGDWYDGLAGEKFDLIVSNPPYVAENDPHVEQGDLRFEPQIALTASDNGLACLHKIIMNAPQHLVAGGLLLLEHGYQQAIVCRQLLADAGFSNIFSQPDLAGIMRVCGGRYDSSK